MRGSRRLLAYRCRNSFAERTSPKVALSRGAKVEIEKLDRLKKAGSISETEFVRLRAKLVQ